MSKGILPSPMSEAVALRSPVRAAIRPEPSLLQSVQMFETLPAVSLQSLAAISELVEIGSGHQLCHEGQQAETLHILLEGQVATFGQAPDGRDALIELIRPIRHVVLGTVLARLPYTVNAKAIASSKLLSIDVDNLHALMRSSPQLSACILRAQAADFGAMVRQVCDLKMRTAAQRLAAYLLELAAERPADTRNLRLPIDKHLLAARLGCRQENLSRAFATLRPFGVETHGRRVILHDIAALRTFSFPGAAGMPSQA
jgi:CRP-like cAMP-binding protein